MLKGNSHRSNCTLALEYRGVPKSFLIFSQWSMFAVGMIGSSQVSHRAGQFPRQTDSQEWFVKQMDQNSSVAPTQMYVTFKLPKSTISFSTLLDMRPVVLLLSLFGLRR